MREGNLMQELKPGAEKVAHVREQKMFIHGFLFFFHFQNEHTIKGIVPN